MIGTTVGSYRIIEKVSVGGMGTVYRAEHELLGKPAAVKVLHPELRANREVVSRFFNEAKATTQIKHPGIVEIFDFGYLDDGDGYIVMEFLEGESLAKRIDTAGQIDEGEAAMILRGVCSALAAAHDRKIIHRDLKPDNIFLSPDPDSPTGERTKLLDFGIAKLNDHAMGGDKTATKTGVVMGTPIYMSPEQCRGTGNLDLRADLYSLGCVFYELVCGRPPFIEEGAGELIGAHLFVTPDSPKKHCEALSDAAERLIMQLLEKDAAKRPQTARELGERLAKIANARGFSVQTNPALPIVSGRMSAQKMTPVPVAGAPGTDATVSAEMAAVPKPTTLSLAASQSVIGVGGGKKKGIIIGVVTAAGIAIGATVVMVMGKSADAPVKKPAAATAPSLTPTPTPTPSPSPSPSPSPTPTEVAPPVATPAPPPVVAPKATPVVVKRHPKNMSPVLPKTDKAQPGQGSGSAKKMLIETDL